MQEDGGERTLEVNVKVHQEDGSYWAEVLDLPGCFASGDTLDELKDGLEEALSLYLSDERGKEQSVRIGEMTLVAEAELQIA
jgi:predicted RNase H-like HicB family nuclease